jgi:hypothetical protein
MMLDPEHYVIGDDGLLVERVGSWAKNKLEIESNYIQISGPTRRKYRENQPAFIDVFCGPGRSLVRETGEYIDGPSRPSSRANTLLSALRPSKSPIASRSYLPPQRHACRSWKRRCARPPGPAVDAITKIVSSLNQYGLHFALLDPHNLGALSFSIIEQLAKLKHIDILVHVSVSDLQRNADLYSSEVQWQFDEFAPKWRKHVSLDTNLQSVRVAMIEYWSDLWSAWDCRGRSTQS